jgi:hypothetical protein
MLMRTAARWVRPKRLQPLGFVVPCQPTLSATVPTGDGWIHELKHDGFRVLAFKDGDTVRLWSRNGRDWSGEFVAITEAMRALPFKRLMLDGEAVAHCPCASSAALVRVALRPERSAKKPIPAAPSNSDDARAKPLDQTTWRRHYRLTASDHVTLACRSQTRAHWRAGPLSNRL